MSAYNADLIRQLEEQFDDAARLGNVAAMQALKERADALIVTALEGIYATRRHMQEEMERQRGRYGPMYEERRAIH